MPTYTRTADKVVTLRRSGGEWVADQLSLMPVGRGDGGVVRAGRVRFPEPDWPRRGTIRYATLTVERAGGSAYDGWRGGSPRLSIRRMTDADTAAGAEVEFAVGSGRTSRDVTAQVRQQLPTRLGGSNERYGLWLVRSSDESNANRSTVLALRVTLTVSIDTRVVPEQPDVLEVVGAQEDEGTGGETIVASDDGRTLEVRFAFAAGTGERCRSVELELRTAGATDGPPATGTVIRSTGSVAPTRDGGQDVYRVRLANCPQGSEGRYRLRCTSDTGKQGPWTSLEDGHVRLSRTPAAPRDMVVQPFVDGPHVQGSLDDPDPDAYVTGAEAAMTLLPQGTLAWEDSKGIGGTTRRADLDTGTDLADGQRTSTVLRLRNQDGVWGRWSPPLVQTHHVRPEVTVSPDPGRFTTRTPTITLGFPLADGARIRLLHETDDDIVVYAGPATPLTDQTSHGFAIPAGTLARGQRFRVQGAYVANGGGTTYGDWSTPVGPYSIAGLPTTFLSVPDAIGRRLAVEAVEWLALATDPDGATIEGIDIELRVAATPQGSGALHRRYWRASPDGLPFAVPLGSVPYESSVDARARAVGDSDDLAATTLGGSASIGATTITLASATGFAIGQDVVIASSTASQHEVRTIANLVSTTATLSEALAYAHASGQAVVARAFGPWSPWSTWDALEPPDVDLLTPADGATVTRPWQALDWSTTGHGGRTQASAVVAIRDADGSLLASVDVEGATSIATVPAFLLDDATTYLWDVTVTDTGGMVATSATRSIATSFSEPDPLVAVSATVVDGSVVLAWDASEDPDLHHYEASWQADDGEWVRIDGGPEGPGDDAPPFVGTTLTHVGARLGTNAYSVRPHDGWRAAEPANATVDLPWTDPTRGSWELVGADGEVIPVTVLDGPRTLAAIADAQQPLGAGNRVVAWGIGPATIPMRIHTIPAEDGSVSMRLRSLLADPSRGRPQRPVWMRPPAGYLLDPVWVVLQTLTSTPQAGGLLELSAEWLEVGDPVHAILPPAPEAPPEGVPDIYASLGEVDFGDVQAPDDE